MKHFYHAWAWFIEALFPPRCIITGREGTHLASEFRNFPPPPENQASFRYLDQIYAHTAYYDPVVEQVVEYFKFKGFKQLAEIMVANIPPPRRGSVEGVVLVPIPLHWSRKLYRGFNQAAVLAQALSRQSAILIYKNLKRQKRTSQQARLNKNHRQKNLQNAFIWKSSPPPKGELEGVTPQTVILIDDVVASGSTLDQAAKACKEAGVREVYAIVFARGGKTQ